MFKFECDAPHMITCVLTFMMIIQTERNKEKSSSSIRYHSILISNAMYRGIEIAVYSKFSRFIRSIILRPFEFFLNWNLMQQVPLSISSRKILSSVKSKLNFPESSSIDGAFEILIKLVSVVLLCSTFWCHRI